jgi:hypothetical protein
MTLTATGAPQAPDRPHREPDAPAASARRPTPQVLRTYAVALSVLLTALTAVAAGLVLAREDAVHRSGTVTEPLLVDAQTLYVALSDADTTAAGALLPGRIAPPHLLTRYRQDVATAAAAVDAARSLAGDDPALTGPLRTLAVGLPFYTATVDRAAAENRMGFPVAGAYQGEASTYMHATLLPAAQTVYSQELAELSSAQRSASRGWPVGLAASLLVATVVVLVVAQLWVRRRFHRSVNVGLAVATVAVLVGACWLTVALRDESRALDQVAADGTAPLTAYSQARIDMLAADADDELTLLTHESVPAYQADYAKVWARFTASVQSFRDTRLSDDRGALEDVHRQIRAMVASNGYPRAIALATDPDGTLVASLPQASAELDADLSAGVATAEHRFTTAIGDAAHSLRGLAFVVALLGLAAWLSLMLGLRPRMREFR